MATSLSLVAGAWRSDDEREAFGEGSRAPRAVPFPPPQVGAEGRAVPAPASPTLSELFSASARDGGWPSTSVRKWRISVITRNKVGRSTAKPVWRESTSTALSTSPAWPRAAAGATIPSRRDHKARLGTGGFS